jgi:hypothetical protein
MAGPDYSSTASTACLHAPVAACLGESVSALFVGQRTDCRGSMRHAPMAFTRQGVSDATAERLRRPYRIAEDDAEPKTSPSSSPLPCASAASAEGARGYVDDTLTATNAGVLNHPTLTSKIVETFKRQSRVGRLRQLA